MIRLYDYELSGCCYKVRLLLNVLKVSCERVPVDFANKEHKTDQFLKLNPLGEVPVMEDGEIRLRDSQSILVYIARQYDRSNTWFPDAPESMGRIMQWLAFGGHELMTASGARAVKLFKYPLDLPALQARAMAAFRILDAHLAGREFLELGHPTIADIACFPYVAMAGEGGIDLKPYPNILHWIDRIKQIPGFIPMPGITASGAAAA
jgi:glutathione S-transferase